jgi:hypothetical protein
VKRLIDETRTISNFWSAQTENYKQQFLGKIPDFAETLGVPLSVEFLLPNIRPMLENKANTP